MIDPLEALVKSRGRPPLAWALEHAPDGTIERAWNGCRDARLLLRVYALTGDRRGLVRAACACARTVLHLVPPGEQRPRRAIEAAEAWCRGEMTEAQVRLAADAANDVPAAACAAAACAAYAFDADAVYAAGYASYAAACAASTRVVYGHAIADLASLVRATVPCPSLAAIAALEAT